MHSLGTFLTLSKHDNYKFIDAESNDVQYNILLSLCQLQHTFILSVLAASTTNSIILVELSILQCQKCCFINF